MKILYVEDDLGGNIPRILNLFGDLLPKNLVKALRELDANESGAKNKAVKPLLDQSGIVHACYDFADAIRTVKGKWQDYKLFILDRNLTDSQGEWDPDEICRVTGYEEDVLTKFLTREGDFLVHLLIPKLQAELGHSVYFLTANTTDAELKSAPEFRVALHECNIGPQNFIQKSDTEACQGLHDIIMRIDDLRVKAQNPDLFKAISLCAPNKQKSLCDILRHGYDCKSNKRWSQMAEMRTITEAALNRLCSKYSISRGNADGKNKTFRNKTFEVCIRQHDDNSAEALFLTIQALASGQIHIDTEIDPDGHSHIHEDEYRVCYGAFRLLLNWSGRCLSDIA